MSRSLAAMINRSLVTTLSALLLLGCAAVPGAPPPDGSGDEGDGPTFGLPGLPQEGLRPSGARVRLVNAFAPLNGDPGPIDVFGALTPAPGTNPLVTVPYGTASTWFDPGVDSEGRAAMSWYPSGRTSDADKLGDQTETLKGGERITIFLGSGDAANPTGTRHGQWRTVYEKGGDASFALATPGAGNALLLAESVGLQNTYGDETLFLSLGNGCLYEQGVTPGEGAGPKPVGRGSNAAFEIPPGTAKLSVHAYGDAAITGEFDCSVPPAVRDVDVTLAAGSRAFLFLHAPKKADLRALVIPIED